MGGVSTVSTANSQSLILVVDTCVYTSDIEVQYGFKSVMKAKTYQSSFDCLWSR